MRTLAPLALTLIAVGASLFASTHSASAAPADHLWSKRFGDASDQTGTSVVLDGAGSALLTGYFSGSLDLGGGPLTSAGGRDIFLAKLDTAGNHLWSKRFGDTSDQTGTSVAADGAGSVFLTGYFAGSVDFGGGLLTSAGFNDIFLAKFDAAGNHLWSKRFGDTSDQTGSSLAVDGTGDVLLTGSFSGAVDFGGGPLTAAGNNDIFLAKLDSAGNHVWSKRFGDASSQGGYGVAVDGAGNALLTGYFNGSADFGGGGLLSAGFSDIFLAEFDPAGNHLWSKRFGDADIQTGLSVAADGSGNALLTGWFDGSVDFGGTPMSASGAADIFLAKFGPAGNHLWSKHFGGASELKVASLAVDGAGNALLTGELSSSVDFGGGPLTSAGLSDIFLAKFDPAGSHLWSERFGDAASQSGYSIAASGAGHVLITGYFAGSVDFGGGPLMSAGSQDAFLAKFFGVGSVGGIAELPDVQALPAATASHHNDHASYIFVTVAAIITVLLAAAGGWRLRPRS